MNDQERHEKYFSTKHLANNLARTSVFGGLTTIGSQRARFALNLGATMVLVRLLTPDDFGLIAMVSLVVIFAAMFKDAGYSMATVTGRPT